MTRLVVSWTLAAAVLVPASLAAQRSRPDVIAPQIRDTAATRFRAERIATDVPELTLWSPSSTRFDQSDFATVFFSVDRDAYVAAFEVGTDGRVRVIYPRSPRDPLKVRGGGMQRVLAGSGFYPEGMGNQQVPYVFVLASFKPLNLAAFGTGKRWQYQLASSRSRSPELTISKISEMMFDEPDADVAADYLYFATRAQTRRALALMALDGCGGSGWNGLSFSDIGTDFFFRNYFIPMWDLYQPFGFFSSIGYASRSSLRCSRTFRRPQYATSTPGTFSPGTALAPGDSAAAPTPYRPPTRVDSVSGPKGAEPTRGPRREKADAEPRAVAERLDIAPPIIMADKYGIAPEPLSERRDKQFTRQRSTMERAERTERVVEARRAAMRGDDRPTRRETHSASSPSETSRGSSSPTASSAPAASAPSPAPAPAPSSHSGSTRTENSPKSAKDP